MADTNQNPITSANVTQDNQNPEGKKSFFWGNEAVFENLEKFEQISNPTDKDQDFDFSFPNEEQDNKGPELENVSIVSSETDNSEEVPPLQDVWLDGIFQPQQSQEKVDLDPLTALYAQEPESLETNNDPLKGESLSQEENTSVLQEELKSEESPLQSFESEISENSVDAMEIKGNSDFQEIDFKAEGLEINESHDTETNSEEVRDYNQDEFSSTYEQETLDPIAKSEDSEEALDAENLEKSSEEVAALEMETEPENNFSDLMKKYQELFEMAKRILKLENKIEKGEKSVFEILGNNTEKSMITYEISPLKDENQLTSLILTKKEKDFSRDEEVYHELIFQPQEENKNLIITVDSTLLYEEEKDLQDPVKAMQVVDKINKFIFLFEQRKSELEEKREEIKAEKEKMRTFRDIFRNF